MYSRSPLSEPEYGFGFGLLQFHVGENSQERRYFNSRPPLYETESIFLMIFEALHFLHFDDFAFVTLTF